MTTVAWTVILVAYCLSVQWTGAEICDVTATNKCKTTDVWRKNILCRINGPSTSQSTKSSFSQDVSLLADGDATNGDGSSKPDGSSSDGSSSDGSSSDGSSSGTTTATTAKPSFSKDTEIGPYDIPLQRRIKNQCKVCCVPLDPLTNTSCSSDNCNWRFFSSSPDDTSTDQQYSEWLHVFCSIWWFGEDTIAERRWD